MRHNPLSVKLNNWVLDNPIIPASGTFGFGYDFAKYYDINILGSISVKGITPRPRFGNPLPRICEIENGMINSIGLQNNGVDHVIKYELAQLYRVYAKPIIANIAAEEIAGYVELIKKLNGQKNISIFEVNISCPNVRKGSLVFDTDPIALQKLLKAIKPISKKPLFIKLSPRVDDIVTMAKIAERYGADGLTLINTMPRLMISSANANYNNRTGGMSGPALRPIALRAIRQCAKVVNIPIIGCGGVSCAKDVIEMMKAGATCVQVGSQNLIDPYACKKIIEELPKLMKRLKIKNLSNIIGTSLK